MAFTGGCKMATNLQRGIYETEDGNAAYVSGPKAKTAYDLDAGESIPIQLVTTKWLRAAEPADKARKGNCYDLKRSIW